MGHEDGSLSLLDVENGEVIQKERVAAGAISALDWLEEGPVPTDPAPCGGSAWGGAPDSLDLEVRASALLNLVPASVPVAGAPAPQVSSEAKSADPIKALDVADYAISY